MVDLPPQRARTVKRRSVEERRCAKAIAEIGATPGKLEPDKRECLLLRRLTTKDTPSEEAQRKSGVTFDTPKDPDREADTGNRGRPRLVEA